MTAIVTTPPSVDVTPPSRRPEPAPVGSGLHRFLGSIPTAVLWVLVAIWTIPTLGIFVSSFRDGNEVRGSGWWTSVEVGSLTPLWASLAGLVVGAFGYYWIRVARIDARRLYLWLSGLVFFGAAGVAVAYTDPGYVLLGGVAGAAAAHLAEWRALGRLRWLLVVGVLLVLAAWLLSEISPSVHTDQGTLDNYREVFSSTASSRINMWDHFFNSVAITIPGTVIPVAIAAFAAYAFAWMDFKGRHWMFITVVALLAVPLQMALVPLLQLWNNGAHLTIFDETFTVFPDLDLQATTTAVWLSHVGFGLPLAVFLLHNYMSSLPRDLMEAARIDGADHPTIFWRLVLPLSVPALAAFSIFQFLWVWNDFLVAQTFLGTSGEGIDNAPMTVRLAQLSGSFGGRWHLLTAAAFVSIVLPVTVFFTLQRYFVRGLLAGSVKG